MEVAKAADFVLLVQVQPTAVTALSNSLCKGARSFSSAVITKEDIEHATGLER